MSIEKYKKGLVSVIIPGFKPDFIEQSIESVLAQTYSNIEIIVVDDGSPYNLKNVLNTYIESGAITYIYQENQKMAAARNTGIKHSQGEFLAFLDDDDLWLPNKIEKQLQSFESSEVGFVYTFAIGFNDKSDIQIANFEIAKNGKIFTDIFLQDFIANSSVMLRSACLKTTGLFKATADYFGVDDCDMWTRISYHFEAACIPEKLTRIRLHDKQFSGDRSIMLFNDLNARLNLINDLQVPREIQKQYLARVYFDIAYNLRITSKQKAFHYYLQSAKNKMTVTTLLAMVKLLIK